MPQPNRYLFALLMAFFMSMVMSFTLTAYRSGIDPQLLGHWLETWPIAFSVAFPTALCVSPLVRKLCLLISPKV